MAAHQLLRCAPILLLLVGSCNVSLDLDDDRARITCRSDAECTEGWKCDPRDKTCHPGAVPQPRCGDGIVDANEQCDCGDDADALPSGCSGPNDDEVADRCRTTCQNATCGDGGLDAAEECDDGNVTAGDGCSASCLRELCGNERIDDGEVCDDGNAISGDDCSADCRSTEDCGNGITDAAAAEECDCGDGSAPLPEGCTAANSDAPDAACRTTCRLQQCGDGVVDTGEECDCGDELVVPPPSCVGSNDDDVPDACRVNCLDSYCGDGTIDGDETCDDGNSIPGDGCNPDCLTRCGDGRVDFPLELCDTGPPPGKTCFDFGFDYGDLGCTDVCTPDLTTCGSLGWLSSPSRTSSQLRGLWAHGGGRVTAVGGANAQAVVRRFDGLQWDDLEPSPAAAGFDAFVDIGNTAWLAGTGDAIYRDDGSGWQLLDVSPHTGNTYYAVWASGPNDVWIVGGRETPISSGLIRHFSGDPDAPLTRDHTSSFPFRAIWGAASNDVWAGDVLGDLHHFNGTAWSNTASVATTVLGLWGSAANDIWAVGANGMLEHYDGLDWSPYSPKPISGVLLYAVWGSGPTDVWAVGQAGTVLHYDGTVWALVHSDTTKDLRALAGTDARDVWAAGDDGVILRFAGGAYSAVNLTGVNSNFGAMDVWGSSSRDIWVVGEITSGVAYHYDGGWSQASTTGAHWFHALWGAAKDDLWVTSFPQTTSVGKLWRYDGADWFNAFDPALNLWDISGTTAADIWAVGANDSAEGVLYRYVSSWTSASTPPDTPPLFGVSAATDSDVWAVGANGSMLHFDGSWSAAAPVTDARLHSVWHDGAGRGWAVGADGALLELVGDSWRLYDASPNPLPTVETLNRVWAAHAGEVWAVGDNGAILHYEGDRWLRVQSEAQDHLHGIWAADGTVWLVGEDRTILRLHHGTAWQCTTTEAACDDGVDNDCDGTPDCHDSDCAGSSPCRLCADGSSEQIFEGGMHGCGGTVPFAERAASCSGGASVCTAAQWMERRGQRTPTLTYWTSERLIPSGSISNCAVATRGIQTVCLSSPSMPVCAGPKDALGNTCTWLGCTLGGERGYFGGCTAAPTAGALCCR